MFFVMNDIDFASCVDDNTPYVSSDSIEDVVRIVENDLSSYSSGFLR